MPEDVMTQMAELLLKSQLGGVEEKINEKIDSLNTYFEAKIDGLKVELQSKLEGLEAIATDKPLAISIGSVENPKKKLVHSAFLTVLNILKSQKRIQKNIMLVGEAGSGKTHLANSIAEALGLKFYPMSVGLQTTKSDLLGFINAHGEYVTSPVREAFEKGGLLLLDEFDSTHAGVVTIINSLLANGHCSFPDQIIEKNENFICIVACNTYGHGANIDYVGRNRLDGATLDRFIVVDVSYDKQLEKKLTNHERWLAIINQIRSNVQKQGIKMIISPRASMNGADLLDAGFKIEDVLEMCVLKGADKDTKQKCLAGVDLTSGLIKCEEYSYTRDLSKYQTFIVKTQEKNYNNILNLTSLNDLAEAQTRYDYPDLGLRMMFGNNWVEQFDDLNYLYFPNQMKEYSIRREYENDYLKEAFRLIEENHLKVNLEGEGKAIPIAFEFIAKGCRTPYKVITMEV